MPLLRRALDVISANHRYQSELREWKSSREYPNEIVRQYVSRRSCNRDIVRMREAGFEVARQDALLDDNMLPYEAGIAPGKYATRGVQVRYVRKPVPISETQEPSPRHWTNAVP
jgi:hypothetical protein